MAAEFHFFSRLPFELQDEIWKLAIRPDLPGAHFFTIYKAYSGVRMPDSLSPSRREKYLGPHIAAPRRPARGTSFSRAAESAVPMSWTLNNPSSYLIDGGLWTACKESRLVIEREVQNRLLRLFPPFPTAKMITYPATDESDHLRYLTVFPARDLYILQPQDYHHWDWKYVGDCFPVEGVKSDHECSESCPQGLQDWKHWAYHIALEYDPGRDKCAKCRPVRRATGLGMYEYWRGPFLLGNPGWNAAHGGQSSFWFIDYRLKRNPRYRAK
ncbi:hypothetical protein QBC47DRAFT_393251 [Echria macrotheca]|uniref:2EXR domain-containing protein n=1 Tax=Echria macrotheca TaxID=438768 RepID=A0AAJ0B2W5_9PEZI|nr:hypothetical protein QBC47DRAFT_393251 [Echria macrotheca]